MFDKAIDFNSSYYLAFALKAESMKGDRISKTNGTKDN